MIIQNYLMSISNHVFVTKVQYIPFILPTVRKPTTAKKIGPSRREK